MLKIWFDLIKKAQKLQSSITKPTFSFLDISHDLDDSGFIFDILLMIF